MKVQSQNSPYVNLRSLDVSILQLFWSMILRMIRRGSRGSSTPGTLLGIGMRTRLISTI